MLKKVCSLIICLPIFSSCVIGCAYNSIDVKYMQKNLENDTFVETLENVAEVVEKTSELSEEPDSLAIEDIVRNSTDKYWDAISALEKGKLKKGIAFLEAMNEDEISQLGQDKYDEALKLAKKYVDSLWNGEWQNPGWSNKRVTKIGIKIVRGISYEDVKKVVYPILRVWYVPFEYGEEEMKYKQPDYEVKFPEDTTDTIYAFIKAGEAGYNYDGDLILVSENVMKFPYYDGTYFQWGRIGSGEEGEYEHKSYAALIEKKEPQIGMTREEVENSTWGKPKTINMDTYSWGTKEQWCYSEGKYIYLENGIVTSIHQSIK